MKQKTRKIVIAEDQQLILDGLVRILSDLPDVEVAGRANNGREVLPFLAAGGIDAVLSDIEMPEMDGIALLRTIRRDYPGVRVLMLSMYNEPNLVRELMALETDGFILKTADESDMRAALRAVLGGKQYFSPEVTRMLSSTAIAQSAEDDLLRLLTAREKEVLQLIAQGFSNKQISEKLFISPKTVDSHRTNLMSKLDIHNVAGLTRFAIANRLI